MQFFSGALLDRFGSRPLMAIAIGFFAGGHMLGFTIAGESVPGNLIGSASAIVNGVCFIIGGLLTSIPSALLPEDPTFADFQAALWLLPADRCAPAQGGLVCGALR